MSYPPAVFAANTGRRPRSSRPVTPAPDGHPLVATTMSRRIERRRVPNLETLDLFQPV